MSIKDERQKETYREIYIYKEREREIDIERERERERDRDRDRERDSIQKDNSMVRVDRIVIVKLNKNMII